MGIRVYMVVLCAQVKRVVYHVDLHSRFKNFSDLERKWSDGGMGPGVRSLSMTLLEGEALRTFRSCVQSGTFYSLPAAYLQNPGSASAGSAPAAAPADVEDVSHLFLPSAVLVPGAVAVVDDFESDVFCSDTAAKVATVSDTDAPQNTHVWFQVVASRPQKMQSKDHNDALSIGLKSADMAVSIHSVAQILHDREELCVNVTAERFGAGGEQVLVLQNPHLSKVIEWEAVGDHQYMWKSLPPHISELVATENLELLVNGGARESSSCFLGWIFCISCHVRNRCTLASRRPHW
jgi:hypothetical protein